MAYRVQSNAHQLFIRDAKSATQFSDHVLIGLYFGRQTGQLSLDGAIYVSQDTRPN